MDLIPVLRRLTATAGLSGFESAIREVVGEIWSPLVDETGTDAMGNLLGLKRGTGAGPRRKLVLASHMDEIGLMVTRIRGGFLSVTNMGNVDSGLLMGQPVLVHGRRELLGVVGSRPPHLLTTDERERPAPMDELVVDVGLPAGEVAESVRVGDLVSFRQELWELMCGRVAAKALDNRASIAAVAVCLEALRSRMHEWDVLVVATVQEEETSLGALASAYSIQPQVAIAVDVTFGEGPGLSGSETVPFGKGPIIGYGPNNHPGVYQGLVEAAEAIELAYHVKPDPRGRDTDAWAMEVVRAGVPAGIVSIPLRNMHMPVEVVELRDIQQTGRLLAEFAARLDERFLEKLTRDRASELEGAW